MDDGWRQRLVKLSYEGETDEEFEQLVRLMRQNSWEIAHDISDLLEIQAACEHEWGEPMEYFGTFRLSELFTGAPLSASSYDGKHWKCSKCKAHKDEKVYRERWEHPSRKSGEN